MSRRTVSWIHKAARGVTLSEVLVVLVIIGIVTAILFPAFQKPSIPPNGAVRDSFGKPLPGEVLRFRNPAGQLVATITADQYGSFRRKGLDVLSKDAVDGFGLIRVSPRTGSGTLYTFTPLGTQIATIHDEAGKPVAGLVFDIGPDHHLWQWGFHAPFEQASDKNGVIQIANIPLSGQFQFKSRDSGYVIKGVQTIVHPNTVRYVVTVSAPATILGQVLSTGGRPLSGYKPFATLGPDIEHHDRHYARWLVTGAAGRFEINGLPPGTYYVRAALAHGYQAVTPVQRVVVVSGQRVTVNLRATPPAQAP